MPEEDIPRCVTNLYVANGRESLCNVEYAALYPANFTFDCR